MDDNRNLIYSDKTLLEQVIFTPSLVEKVYSVSEFINYVNDLLYTVEFVVQGEITGLTERGAAIYFSLSDKNEKAILNCLIWKNKLNGMGISLKEGMEVKVSGKANIYKPYGKFSFNAEYIIPVGEGALKQAFEQLKARLQEQGYFDTSRKREIPSYVSTIGLLTSENADAKKDFLTHYGQHRTKIYYYDIRVEGVKSIETIVQAIRWFNENPKDIEVLVLTRGGGSMESLQAFNSEAVAKAIFSSKIPIISAIGHENDISISDLVADYRASTPTDAGKFLSENWNKAQEIVYEIQHNIYSVFLKKCKETTDLLEFYKRGFIASYKNILDTDIEKISGLDRSFSGCLQEMIRNFGHISATYEFSFNEFETMFSEYKNELRTSELYFHDSSARWFKTVAKKIGEYEKNLVLSEPNSRLKQGYSIAFTAKGRIIKSSQMVGINDDITIKLYSGELETQIKTIKQYGR